MATATGRGHGRRYVEELPLRLRTFVWLVTGMFSAAAMALAFLGYFWIGTAQDAASHFLACIISGVLFGAACTLRLGPDAI